MPSQRSTIDMIFQTIAKVPTFLSKSTRNKLEHAPMSDVSITYGIIEERYTLNDRSRIAYGIAAYADVEIDATATIVASIHDITSDLCDVITLADICNRMNVPPQYLRDVVEDYLES